MRKQTTPLASTSSPLVIPSKSITSSAIGGIVAGTVIIVVVVVLSLLFYKLKTYRRYDLSSTVNNIELDALTASSLPQTQMGNAAMFPIDTQVETVVSGRLERE
jgi:hypothetical protein